MSSGGGPVSAANGGGNMKLEENAFDAESAESAETQRAQRKDFGKDFGFLSVACVSASSAFKEVRRVASADFSRKGLASSATRHSGLDPESSSVPLDSGVRRNDGFHVGAPRLFVEEAK